MTSSSTTLLAWILTRLSSKHTDYNDNISLEALNNKIRLFVWIFLLLHVSTVAFLSETRLPILFYLFCYGVWFGYLYLLLRTKNEFIKGIPFLIVNLGAALALILKGESYYLRLTTFSLPSLPIYSVQGFPPIMMLVLGAGYFWLHTHYNHYIDAFYEPITASYRIPAISLENTLKGYRIGLFLEIFCLLVYQIIIQRIWRNYQKAKKNLEETNQKLQAVNLQLAKNVEELAHLNKQLEHALQSQDLFVACVSHELRNPLNVMLGSLDLLEPQVKDNNQIQLLKTCRVCGDALLSQINNLLDVAKISADKLEISEFATNMGVFLERFWAFTKIGLEKKGLFGSLSVDKTLSLWLNVDSHRLQQIMNNLVGNAIKFTTTGSVRISVRWSKENTLVLWNSMSKKKKREKENLQCEYLKEGVMPDEDVFMLEGDRQEAYCSKKLQKKNDSNNFITFKPHQSVKDKLEESLLSYEETQNNYLKIDVIDTGCGISKEAQQNIFEPFVQGDRSVTRKYGGTGLGLYIVKSLVSKMGGDIKVSSQKDIGTHFQIVLPVKSVKRVHGPQNLPSSVSTQSLTGYGANLLNGNRWQSEPNSITSLLPRNFKKVLIVDDDIFNQNLLKEYFKKFDLECDTGNNGFEGLQKYKDNLDKYSFITMDIQMPGMDGITACKNIRTFEKENGRPRIPIVIVTGNCSEDERKVCLDGEEIQASYFFRKPFRLSDCKLCIEKIILDIQQP